MYETLVLAVIRFLKLHRNPRGLFAMGYIGTKLASHTHHYLYHLPLGIALAVSGSSDNHEVDHHLRIGPHLHIMSLSGELLRSAISDIRSCLATCIPWCGTGLPDDHLVQRPTVPWMQVTALIPFPNRHLTALLVF